MNKLIFTLSLIFLLTACQNEKTENDDQLDKNTTEKKVELDINEPDFEEIPVLRKCYTYKDDNTVAVLNIELENELVTGSLSFSGDVVKEGNVTGEFTKDTLFLTYKYVENEITKAKELALLEDKKEFTLQMASADYDDNNGVKIIKDRSNIKFNDMLFKKLDCDQD